MWKVQPGSLSESATSARCFRMHACLMSTAPRCRHGGASDLCYEICIVASWRCRSHPICGEFDACRVSCRRHAEIQAITSNTLLLMPSTFEIPQNLRSRGWALCIVGYGEWSVALHCRCGLHFPAPRGRPASRPHAASPIAPNFEKKRTVKVRLEVHWERERRCRLALGEAVRSVPLHIAT